LVATDGARLNCFCTDCSQQGVIGFIAVRASGVVFNDFHDLGMEQGAMNAWDGAAWITLAADGACM